MGAMRMYRLYDTGSQHIESNVNTIPRHQLSDEHLAVLANRPHDIPIVHGPLRGPEHHAEISGDYTQFGSVLVVGESQRDYQRARDYLSYGQYDLTPKHDGVGRDMRVDLHAGDPVMHSIFLHLEDRCDAEGGTIPTVVVVENAHKPKYVPFEDGISMIEWPSRKSLATADGNGLSPALILGHEATHAYHRSTDPLSATLRAITPEHRYTTREEFLTIQRENAAARLLGEGLRNSHGSIEFLSKAFYSVRHPMDRQHPQKLKFPTRLALMTEQTYSTNMNSDCAVHEHMESLAQIGPGWHAYVDRQRRTAKNLEKKYFYRALAYALTQPLNERLANASALYHDAFARKNQTDN